MADETPILNIEITETLEEILKKEGFSKSSHKILLSILEEIATSDASHGSLKEKINHLGKAAQLRAVKEFGWEKVIKNHISTYKKNNII